jgi:hypothetical protein
VCTTERRGKADATGHLSPPDVCVCPPRWAGAREREFSDGERRCERERERRERGRREGVNITFEQNQEERK